MAEDLSSIRAEEASESQKHDELYERERPARLLVSESAWKRFERPQEPLSSYTASMQRIVPLEGRRVLDAGCGNGWSSVILAKRGAHVVGFDISRVAARVARERARVNGVAERCAFVVASSYALPFRPESFDAAMGQSILHHLQHKEVAARELWSVMRPSARALFSEPFGNALWLERLRLAVPVPSGAPEDPDEWGHQFKYADLEPFQALFDASIEEFQFFSRLDRVFGTSRFVRFLNRLDRWLLARLRWLRPYAREVLIELRREAADARRLPESEIVAGASAVARRAASDRSTANSTSV